MEKLLPNLIPQFQTPQEEIEYLRSKIAEREKNITESTGEAPLREHVISESVTEYRNQGVKESAEMNLSKPEIDRIILKLSPEDHDSQMSEIIAVLRTSGLKSVYKLLEKINSPHVDDDFHRYLVEYFKEGYTISSLKEKETLYKNLHMTLFEVALPQGGGDQQKNLKEIISSMENFYAGMLSVSTGINRGQNYFAIEIAMENIGEEFAFYVAISVDKKELFAKHIVSVYPQARITEKNDDYNIFNDEGVAVGSVADFGANSIFPIKTYEQFDHDPLSAILSSFSKIDAKGEGAALQIILNPVGADTILNKFQHALTKIQKGENIKKTLADIHFSMASEIVHGFKDGFKDFFAPKKKLGEVEKPPAPADPEVLQNIQNKVGSPLYKVNMRLVASSRTLPEAEAILNDMESAFNQFENTKGNKIVWKRASRGDLARLLKDFSYRTYSDSHMLPMNIHELTSILHFDTLAVKGTSSLRVAKSGSVPAPVGLSSEGILIGINNYQNTETKIYMSEEDRLRHFYLIGQTGTGKSTEIKNMIVQDIEQGHGVCMIDPHGSDIQDILAAVPESRYKDVIYFDPSHTERPMALNMLEYDTRFPEQKTFVVNELFSIFQKLYGANPESMGPMFEQYFRNATMLVIEDPESGSTLLDVSRVLSDKVFRELKLSRCKNPIVVQFWREIAEKAGGEGALQNIVPYITSKFDAFLANDFMRPIIAQEKSSFNFREIMDNKKILLVNLSKGRLGDINANLIGLIIVGKILMAALSRVDSFGQTLPNFYLFIDEFQNITTNSIATILSEARKYRLSLTVAHQFIAQLEENIRNAVFGNVGSMAAFRVGAEDAEVLQKQFEPVFKANDLMNVDNYNAFVRILANGKPVRPFNIQLAPKRDFDRTKVDRLKELSYLTFGGDRAAIEEAIMKKYRKAPAPAQPAPVPKV